MAAKCRFISTAQLKHASLPSKSATSAKFSVASFVWIRGGISFDDCCVLLCKNESKPLCIVTSDDGIQVLSTMLHLLNPSACVISVSLKTSRSQLGKTFSGLNSKADMIMVVSDKCVPLLGSCYPKSWPVSTVIHHDLYDESEFCRRIQVFGNLQTAKHVVLWSHSYAAVMSPAKLYEYEKKIIPVIQARVAVARKLVQLKHEERSKPDESNLESNSESAQTNRAFAAKYEALSNKLKVLLSCEPPGQAGVGEGVVGSSAKEARVKMVLLGLIYERKDSTFHAKADEGRSLAVTQWLDSLPGSVFGCPWGSVRHGACADCISVQAQRVISAFRRHIAKRFEHKKRKFEKFDEFETAPRLTCLDLSQLRVVGWNWRPNPNCSDNSEWGGEYGKCCGHNEVAMFFARPFFPLEVLNTHVCSQSSPAPGNAGFEGCLEFLQTQCRWFKRAMTVWDDKFIHFIGPDGVDRSLDKRAFLSWDKTKISVYFTNLRHLTIDTHGSVDPRILLDYIQLLLHIATGKVRFSGLGDNVTRCQRKIISFLLLGSATSWAKSTNYS